MFQQVEGEARLGGGLREVQPAAVRRLLRGQSRVSADFAGAEAEVLPGEAGRGRSVLRPGLQPRAALRLF